jgi:hypothetical protein
VYLSTQLKQVWCFYRPEEAPVIPGAFVFSKMTDISSCLRGFEQLAIQVCLSVCTVSQVARLVRNECKLWRSPKKKKRRARNR